MSKWEMVRLGDVCERKVQSLPANSDFEIVYIDIASIDNTTKKMVSFRVIDAKNAPSRAKQVLKKNDIIVSTVRPNLNAVAIVTQESDKVVVGSTGYCVLRCTDEAITEYIFYFCQSKKFIGDLVKVAKGASYPAVSDSDVKDIQIPLPPIEVQKKIAQTLDTVAELIALRKKQLAELDNLIKSTFYDMFGDPVTNEKGWNLLFVQDVYDIIDGDRGINYPNQEDFDEQGYCLFLNTGNVTKCGFNLDKLKFISEEKDKQLRKGKLQREDIILTTRGTVGNIAHYGNNVPFDVIRINSGMVILRDRTSKIIPRYFCELFRSNEMSRKMNSFLSGTAQPQLPITNLKRIDFPLPPLPLQNQFAEIVTKIEEQKALVQQAIAESQYLFDSLMNEYFG